MGRRSGKRRQKPGLSKNGEGPAKKEEEKTKSSPAGLSQGLSYENLAQSRLGQWLKQEKWTLIFLIGIVLLAFLIRTVFFAEIAFSTWPPRLAGNDPMYHKWAIDFVQTNARHFRLDEMLNYPLRGGNPRPPFFNWSVAVLGIALGPFMGGTERATWYIFEFSPSIWGTATIFPIYLIGKEIFGKKEGMLASFLFALSPAHIERSVLGFSDHDAIIVFFLVLSYFFLIKGLSQLEDRKWIKDWRKPGDVVLGLRDLFRESRIPLAYFALAGTSIGTVALTWKGFPYLLAIILIYYLVQIVFNKFRKVDSTSFFVAIFIVMALPLAMSLPYYYVYTINTWMTPFYIVMAMVAIGVMFVPTRDIPWIVVIPGVAAFLGASYAFLHFVSPETQELLFSGGGYFVTNKLYSTIAEAQRPDLSRMIVSITPATFFAAVVGIVWAAFLIPKRLKKDYLFVVAWGAVAVFMAISAVRFEFNAMPIFCIMAGWIIMKAIKRFNPNGVATLIVSLVSVGLLGLFLVLNYYRIDKPDSKYYFALDDLWFFDKIGLHDDLTQYLKLIALILVLVFTIGLFLFMRYGMKKEKYRLGTIIVALGVAFIVIMPGFFLAIDASTPYEKKREFDPDFTYMGSFGSSFTSEYWESGMDWMAEQDINQTYEDRPAWISWWDYGFWSVYLGQHPTVADNFQNGYQLAGSFIGSQNESEAIALLTIRILEGDYVRNAIDNGDPEFTPEVKAILIEHLDDGNTNFHPNYDRFLTYYRNPAKYIETVENDPNRFGHYIDLKAPNAKYAMARVHLVGLGLENIVDLYTDVNKATDWEIRYFGVDSRLFPFNAQNTGIFYAPIKLADKDVNDYLIYLAYCQKNEGTNEDPNWVDYPDNPLTPDRVEQEAENLENKFRIIDYELKYSDLFYNSMFYKCYIGYSTMDVGAPRENNGVPSMFGEIGRYPAMQGWNMTHFKSVYKTMYYSDLDENNASFPDDYVPMNYDTAFQKYQKEGGDIKSGLGQGVFILKYYHGAQVNGTLRLPNGTPLGNARIVVQDEFGVPHGTYITPEDGSYSIILPFGQPKLIVTKNELRPASESLYDHIYQYKIDTTNFFPIDPYNVSAFDISDDQAMRIDPEWQIEQDMTVLPASVRGRIYFDWDNNARYEAANDELVEDAYLRLEMTDGNWVYKNAKGYEKMDSHNYLRAPGEPEQYVEEGIHDGQMFFKDLVPGTYQYKLVIDGHEIELPDQFEIKPGDNLVGKDVIITPSNITGKVFNPNGTLADAVNLTLTNELSGELSNFETANNGTYWFERLMPGNYTLTLDEDGYYRESHHMSLGHGVINKTDFGLIPVSTVKGFVSFSGSEIGAYPADNVIVQFTHLTNDSLSRAVYTQGVGQYTVDLALGTYSIYTKSIEGRNIFSDIGLLEVASLDTNYEYDLSLSNSLMINGSITKLVDTPVYKGEIKFIDSEGSLLKVLSNNTGNYMVHLPYDEYGVEVYHVTEVGNNTFIHQSVLDLRGAAEPYVTANFHTEKGAVVQGFLFWDMDGDGEFTPEFAINNPNIGGGGTRSNGDNEPPEIPVEDGGITVIDPFAGDEDEGDKVQEGIPGIELTFKSANNELTVTTNSDGSFLVPLPMGNFTVTASDPALHEFEYILDIPENPTPISDELVNQRYQASPKQVELNLAFFSDINSNGNLDAGEEAGDLPVRLEPVVPQLGTINEQIGEEGDLDIVVFPTTYSLKINHSRTEGPMEAEYGLDRELPLIIGGQETSFDIPLTKKLGFTTQIFYEDEMGFEHPADNVTVRFIPVLNTGGPTGSYYFVSDINGLTNVSIYEGDYTVSISASIGNTNYVFQERYLCTPLNPLESIVIKRSVNVTGLVTDQTGSTVDDLPIAITNLNTNATINVTTQGGRYSASLLPDTDYRFFVDYHFIQEDKDVWHTYEGLITVSQLNKTFDLKVTKYLLTAYNIYFDLNNDGLSQENELIGGIDVHIHSDDDQVPDEYRDLSYKTNASGGFKDYLPYGSYKLTVDSYKYKEGIKGGGMLDISFNSAVSRDLAVIARDVEVRGWTRIYSDLELMELSTYSNLKDTFIRFIPVVENEFTQEVTTTSVVGGVYEADLYPGEYIVHAYNINNGVYVHLGVREFVHEASPVFNISLLTGDEVKGAVFFYDTNQTLRMNITQTDGLTITRDGAKIRADIFEGTFQAYLPEGFSGVSASYDFKEYDKTMTYSVSTDLNVSRDHDDLAAYSLQLLKEEDYSLFLDFASLSDFQRMSDANQTVTYNLKIKNTGNVRSTVTWEIEDLPQGWKIEYAQEEVELDINEQKIVQVNVTLSHQPLSSNLMTLYANTVQGSGSTSIKLDIDTPDNFDFDMKIPGDKDNGVYFNSVTDYNISIINNGNSGDTIQITMELEGDNLDLWNVTFQSDEKVSESLFNVSIPEYDTRNFSLSIRAPNSSVGDLNDELVLTFTARSMFYPQQASKTETIRLQVRRANLYIKDWHVENNDLKDHEHKFTLNFTIASENIEVAPSVDTPLCTLYEGDNEIGTENINYIREDGVGYVEFVLNATMRDWENETVKLRMVLDDDDNIPETNEDDNEWVKKIGVGEVGPWYTEIPWLVVITAVAAVAIAAGVFIWWRRRSIYA